MTVTIKRKFSLLASAFVLAAMLVGCAEESGAQEEELLAAEEAGDSEAVDGDPADKAGKSYVQYCNAPGDNGTVCRQQGCSGDACYAQEAAAISECRSEVRSVCGSPVQPFFIVFKADGFWQRL